jgi:hypothetical protein
MHGLSDASTDETAIRRWWELWPDANVGLAIPPGYVVVDVDVPDVNTVLRNGHNLPPTALARTGRGWHFLFSTDVPIRPKVAVLEHVDLRGPGSYIVAEPSRHISGANYQWVVPPKDGIAQAPAWIDDLATSSRARDAEAEPGEPIGEGGRNAALASLGGTMRRRGMTEGEIAAALLEVNRMRCVPPLADEEVRGIAASVSRYRPGESGWAVGDDRRDDPDSALTFPEPEDRGTATLSPLGEVEYVEDLVRPGRIIVWAAEEGSGKSFAVDDELGIRMAVAGGSFAGTWPMLRSGPVLVMSEMHADDDFDREETTLASLELPRSALSGRYFRLPLMTAAGGRPALTVPEWRDWATGWLRDHGALLLIVDTATGATQVDPWGKGIQEVYANLRVMLDAYPALAIILIVHVRKPTGRGERRLSDVLGEWGRWCDIVVMQENDGASLERAKITVRKRVRHERRIVATKAGGLLIDPVDLAETKGTKVPLDDVIVVIQAKPGITYADLGEELGVSADTASNYVKRLGDQVDVVKTGSGKPNRVFPTSEAPKRSE